VNCGPGPGPGLGLPLPPLRLWLADAPLSALALALRVARLMHQGCAALHPALPAAGTQH
jgi:hypothetical protein